MDDISFVRHCQILEFITVELPAIPAEGSFVHADIQAIRPQTKNMQSHTQAHAGHKILTKKHAITHQSPEYRS